MAISSNGDISVWHGVTDLYRKKKSVAKSSGINENQTAMSVAAGDISAWHQRSVKKQIKTQTHQQRSVAVA